MKNNQSKEKITGKIWVRFLIFGVIVFILFAITKNDNNAKKVESSNPTVNTSSVSVFVYDIPNLVSKNIDEARNILGPSTDGDMLEPTDQQKLGSQTWYNTWKKDGKELAITYNVSTRIIEDFFIATDNSSGATNEKDRLLQIGNLSENDSSYTVEFVKSLKNSNEFTGVKVIPKY